MFAILMRTALFSEETLYFRFKLQEFNHFIFKNGCPYEREAIAEGLSLMKFSCLNINSFLFLLIDEKQRKNTARLAVVTDVIEA